MWRYLSLLTALLLWEVRVLVTGAIAPNSIFEPPFFGCVLRDNESKVLWLICDKSHPL
jgi:hypothetical protein